MRALSLLLMFFPTLILTLTGADLLWFAYSPSPVKLLAVPALLYLVPLGSFRILNAFLPMREGVSRLSDNGYSPWWAAHQAQQLYLALPFLESVLMVIPGLFSFWLRLWGSHIGRGVYWVPTVLIGDRSLMRVGNRVVFGHAVQCFGHLIKPKEDRQILYVRRVTIEDDVFLGGFVRLAPGCVVGAGNRLPSRMDVMVNVKLAPRSLSGADTE